MEELKKEIEGLKVARSKIENSISGSKKAIVYRGSVILASTAVVSLSSYAIVKNVSNIGEYVIEQNGLGIGISVLAIGASTVLIPLGVKVILYQVDKMRDNKENFKLSKSNLIEWNNKIEKKEEELAAIQKIIKK